MTRKIIHIDLDAFFCAVEELCNPKLVGKAFAVGGRPEERGVVSSCSYPARRFGVHSAMPMVVALRQCPELIIISSHYSEYARLSEQMAEHLFGLTPLVEQISIDEAFLDVTEITEPVERTADILQKRINDQLHLPCSLGVATNKLVAKIANDYGKSGKRGRVPCTVDR
jgi:DNA polymerase-4